MLPVTSRDHRAAEFIAIALIAVLLALGVGLFVKRRRASLRTHTNLVSETRTALRVLGGVLSDFELDCGRFPAAGEGLSALVESPGVPGWRGPYLKTRAVPKDAWGRKFVYGCKDGIPQVVSRGRDGNQGTKDDLILEFEAGRGWDVRVSGSESSNSRKVK